MRLILRTFRLVMLAGLAIGLSATALQAGDPHNWKGGATGAVVPVEGVHVDTFAGKSTHLGRFTAEGFHVLNPLDFTFVGQATWTASNGDTLSVTFGGQVFFSGDPDFPFGFVADLNAVGGTGRLAGAKGSAIMTGAFSGIPGEFYFDFDGTLKVGGN